LEAQRKSLTVIIVLLEGRLERQKEIVDRFDFQCVDAMALNNEIRLLKKMFQFYLLDDLLESRNAELSFPKKFFVTPKTVLTTLYLFFRG